MQKIYFSYIAERYSSLIHDKMWPCFNSIFQFKGTYRIQNQIGLKQAVGI